MYYILFLVVIVSLMYAKSVSPIKQCKSIVINLDRSKTRLNEFINQYKSIDMYKNVPLMRFRGYEGRRLNIRDYVTWHQYQRILHLEEFNERYYHKDMNRGAVGCFVSHVQVMKALIQDMDVDYYIVFEDDAKPLTKDVLERIQLLLTHEQNDWDMILIGGTSLKSGRVQSPYCKKIYYFWGLYGYIISKSGAKRILQHIFPIDMQIDSKLSKLALQKKINILMTKDPIFTHSAESTIQHSSIRAHKHIDPFALV